MPDVPITTRSTDFLARYDPTFAAILGRMRGVPPAPSGNVITVNGASFRTDQGIAPGSFATAFGSFSQTPDQVTVNGVAGRFVAGSTSQVNFIVPASISPGTATISVRAGGLELANGQAAISAVGPGIFVLNGADPSQPGAVENQDNSVNSSSNPAARASVVQIFATGYGQLSDPRKCSLPTRLLKFCLAARLHNIQDCGRSTQWRPLRRRDKFLSSLLGGI